MSKRYVLNTKTNRLVDAEGYTGLKIIKKLKQQGIQVKYQSTKSAKTKSTKSAKTKSTKSTATRSTLTDAKGASSTIPSGNLISVKSNTTGQINTFTPTSQKAKFTQEVEKTPAIQAYLIPKTPTCRQCTLKNQGMNFLRQEKTRKTKMWLKNVNKHQPTLFDLTPPENRINKTDVRMFHGTGFLSGWNKIKDYGIQPIGDGDMGLGFYVTPYVDRALQYAYANQKDTPVLIEIIIKEASKLKVQLLETKIKKGTDFTSKNVVSLPTGGGLIWQFAVSSPEIIKQHFRINRLYKWGDEVDTGY